MASLFVVTIVFLSAILRAVAGFGFALVAVPLLALILTPVEAVTIGILLQVVVGIFEVVPCHGSAHRASVYRLSAGALIATPLGVWALTALDPDLALICIALAILAGLVFILRTPTAQGAGHGTAITAGLAAGVFSGLAAIPGPPAVAYYLRSGIDAPQVRASLLVFCFVTVLAAVPGLFLAGAIDRDVLILCAICTPALFAGTWLGGAIFRRLDGGQYRNIGVAVMALSATLAGWRGITAYF